MALKSNFDNKIFYIILLLFGFEYVEITQDLSIFRLFIFPLSLFGLFRLGNNTNKNNNRIIIFIIISLLNLVYGFICSDTEYFLQAFINLLGVISFIIYLVLYIRKYHYNKNYLLIFSLYSLPHVIAFIPYILQSQYFSPVNDGRFYGFHIDCNFLGALLNMSMMAKYYYSKYCDEKYKKLLYIGIALDILMTGFTFSRGAYLVLALVVPFIIIVNRKFKYVFLLLVILTLTFTYISSQYNTLTYSHNMSLVDKMLWRVKALDNSEDGNVEGRITHFYNFLSLVNDGENGLVGYSIVKYLNRFRQYPHNVFIDIFLQSGLFIGGIFVAYIISLIVRGIRYARNNLFNQAIFMVPFIGFCTLFFLSSYESKLFWLLIILMFFSGENKTCPMN